MDEGSIDRLREDLGEADGLWPEHVEILEAFLLCETQWRVATVSAGLASRIVCIGLDYVACRVALEFAGIAVTPALWSGLREFESAALAELNAKVPA